MILFNLELKVGSEIRKLNVSTLSFGVTAPTRRCSLSLRLTYDSDLSDLDQLAGAEVERVVLLRVAVVGEVEAPEHAVSLVRAVMRRDGRHGVF